MSSPAISVSALALAALLITACDSDTSETVPPTCNDTADQAPCETGGSCEPTPNCEPQVDCDALACAPGDIQVDVCPANVECYDATCPGVNGGTFYVLCAPADDCNTPTACDPGDTQVSSCGPNELCYTTTGCTGSVTCIDNGLGHHCPLAAPADGETQCGTATSSFSCEYDDCARRTCTFQGPEPSPCCTWTSEPICP